MLSSMPPVFPMRKQPGSGLRESVSEREIERHSTAREGLGTVSEREEGLNHVNLSTQHRTVLALAWTGILEYQLGCHSSASAAECRDHAAPWVLLSGFWRH
jgi:hypothetical protein